MEESYWWYVLFVRTNSERRVIREILDYVKVNKLNFEVDAFVPESEYYYRNKKRELGKEYLRRPLFPGYVFIETNIKSQEFLANFSQFAHNSADIIKILRYGENGEIAITFEERRRWEYMFRGKRCLEHSQGFIVGDKVIIENGPLIGREGNIKYINRHNRIAKVEFVMFGRSVFADVALEIVKKI
jgi:transcriptional antiterminator NusG